MEIDCLHSSEFPSSTVSTLQETHADRARADSRSRSIFEESGVIIVLPCWHYTYNHTLFGTSSFQKWISMILPVLPTGRAKSRIHVSNSARLKSVLLGILQLENAKGTSSHDIETRAGNNFHLT